MYNFSLNAGKYFLLYRSLADIANHQRFIPEPRVLLTALKLAIGETLGWRRGRRMQTRTTFPITTPLSTRGNPDVAAPEAHSRSRNRGVPEINEYSLFRNSNLTREASSGNPDLECDVCTTFLSLSLPLFLSKLLKTIQIKRLLREYYCNIISYFCFKIFLFSFVKNIYYIMTSQILELRKITL